MALEGKIKTRKAWERQFEANLTDGPMTEELTRTYSTKPVPGLNRLYLETPKEPIRVLIEHLNKKEKLLGIFVGSKTKGDVTEHEYRLPTNEEHALISIHFEKKGVCVPQQNELEKWFHAAGE